MEAARLDLTASKQKLEEDIRVKKNSIAIDQVTLFYRYLHSNHDKHTKTYPNQVILYFVDMWRNL